MTYIANGFSGIGPAITTGLIDQNSADITPIVVLANSVAGSIGLAADSGHEHAWAGDQAIAAPLRVSHLVSHSVAAAATFQPGSIIVPTGQNGWYQITANITFLPGASWNAGFTPSLQLFKNAGSFIETQQSALAGYYYTLNLPYTLYLIAGDTLSLQYTNPSGSGDAVTFAVAQVATTIAVGSNLQSLPQPTIFVASTTGMTTNNYAYINTTSNGQISAQLVYYSGTTSNTLTGCTGGTGLMATGNPVSNQGYGSVFSALYLHA